MAATAASFSTAAFEPTDRDAPSAQELFGKEPDIEWVLPSQVDALGRSVESVPLLVMLRKTLSLKSIRDYITRLRQPPF